MKLTDEEKEVIKKLREEKESDKPYRGASLKHDLYSSEHYDGSEIAMQSPFIGQEEITQENVLRIIKILQDSFEKVLEKGAKFDSYIDDGEELWYDGEGYGIEGRDNKWAEKHLENFKVLRKRK